MATKENPNQSYDAQGGLRLSKAATAASANLLGKPAGISNGDATPFIADWAILEVFPAAEGQGEQFPLDGSLSDERTTAGFLQTADQTQGVPLTELERQTLALWCDQDWNLREQSTALSPSIVALHSRFKVTRDAVPPVQPRVPTPTADDGEEHFHRWDEFLRLDVRWGAVVAGVVLGLVVFVAAAVANVLR